MCSKWHDVGRSHLTSQSRKMQDRILRVRVDQRAARSAFKRAPLRSLTLVFSPLLGKHVIIVCRWEWGFLSFEFSQSGLMSTTNKCLRVMCVCELQVCWLEKWYLMGSLMYLGRPVVWRGVLPGVRGVLPVVQQGRLPVVQGRGLLVVPRWRLPIVQRRLPVVRERRLPDVWFHILPRFYFWPVTKEMEMDLLRYLSILRRLEWSHDL